MVEAPDLLALHSFIISSSLLFEVTHRILGNVFLAQCAATRREGDKSKW
jgi:hypothetical protein